MTPERAHRLACAGESAYALGVERPPYKGQYLFLDAYATILASYLNCYCGLELKQAAHEVREHWQGWLELLTRVERWHEHSKDDPRLFFAIARLLVEDKDGYRACLGSHDQIAADLGGKAIALSGVSIARVLHQFRANAEHAGIAIPERLTVAKGEDGYDDWWDEIDAYRKAAGVRVTKTAKRLVKA